ncbi:MAG: M50 family metallopeptidase, partial [Pseudonocardia sp.]
MTPEVQAAVTTPIVAAAAVSALLLFVTSGAARAFGTVAHESGHMVVGILTGHTVRYFEVTIGGEGATHWAG